MTKKSNKLNSGGLGSSGSNGGGSRFARETVTWTEEMTEYLLDALMHEQEIGNRSDGRFLSVAFKNVISGVAERFGVTIDRSNIKNRLKHVKDVFHECENLFDKESGVKWNPASGRFFAEPHVWMELIQRKSDAKKWMSKSIDHYDKLLELFGKDRERRPAVQTPKSTQKKARIEPPKETSRSQRTPSNDMESAVVAGSNQAVNSSKSPKSTQKKARIEPPKERSRSQRTPSNDMESDVVVGSNQAVNSSKRPKSTQKKARIEPPEEGSRSQRTPSNNLELAVGDGSNKAVNASKVSDEVVMEKCVPEELDLSESCRSENVIVAIPVPANAYGKGLPYAPENWPCSGDEWHWRVGNRTGPAGHYWVDRYLTPPSRFRDATGKKTSFSSKLKVEEFIEREFPEVDPSTFFSMFIWRIPAEGSSIQRGAQQVRLRKAESGLADPTGPCKARNELCKLTRDGFIESSPAQDCDCCCTQPDFCRECCCILCKRAVEYSFDGYSYIKCEAVLEEGLICGHVAHLECALRIWMAGTVGGEIDLDVQYYCRRCDNKTNLLTHVEKLLETCKSLQSRDEIEPVLNTGLCILRGSRQTKANRLENYMGSAHAKLKCGVDLVEVWKTGDDDEMAALSGEESSPSNGGATVLGTEQQYPYLFDPLVRNELQRSVEDLPVFITGDHKEMSLKYENEIDEALQELKRSQEAGYRLAELKLYAQKDRILSLYRKLESERSQLADPTPLCGTDRSHYSVLLGNVVKRVNEVKREEEKLKAMLQVRNGFGSVTQEHFGLSTDV